MGRAVYGKGSEMMKDLRRIRGEGRGKESRCDSVFHHLGDMPSRGTGGALLLLVQTSASRQG